MERGTPPEADALLVINDATIIDRRVGATLSCGPAGIRVPPTPRSG
jgi:hypothetical protein